MPTIKDIAARAGVSHGAVSNVLNKRGNVSAEKIQLVEQAARELGYQLNAQAQDTLTSVEQQQGQVSQIAAAASTQAIAPRQQYWLVSNRGRLLRRCNARVMPANNPAKPTMASAATM